MTFQISDATARAKYYDSAIKQIANRKYKFKQVVSVVSTSAWKNYFYREDTSVLSGATGNGTKGIPRGAEFPQASVEWTRVQTTIEKYGLEENIPWEDLISDEIDVLDRSVIKIAEGVTKAVDDEIYSVLSSDSAIQKITIDEGYEWNASSAAIMDNLQNAMQLIEEANYDTDNLMALVSPKDFRSMMNYIYEKGAQAPKMGEVVLGNGRMMNVAGITFIKSNSVPASEALVVVPKRCATWKQLVPLQSTTKTDAYKSETIRAVEMGVTQVTDPKAVVRLVNTQA